MKDVVNIQDVLLAMVNKLGWSELYLQSRIENDWIEILGENISKVVKIAKLKDKVLTLKVYSSTWRTEMTLRREWLKETLNSRYGKDSIQEIVIR